MQPAETKTAYRILVVVTAMGLGGAEMQVFRLAMELRARGWEVCVVTLIKQQYGVWSDPLVHQLKQEGIAVYSLNMERGVPDLRAVFRLRSLIRSFRPDVVHSHMYHANLLGRVTRLFCRIPALICTAHSTREDSRRGGSTWHKELLYRLTDPLADRTTIICNAAFERYVRVGAVPRHKLCMIPNGIETDLFVRSPEQRQRTRRALGIGPGEFVWLAVGRLVKAKDYPSLLSAVEQLGRGNYVVLIAGTGLLEQELRDDCSRRGLDGQVRFLGVRTDVTDLYSAADAFVMSSELEGLPLALLEAASAGLPAVVTDVGGNCDIVTHEVNGYVVPPGDPAKLAAALRRLMEDSPQQWMAMSQAARRHCLQHYCIAAVMEQWLELYSQFLPDLYCERASSAVA